MKFKEGQKVKFVKGTPFDNYTKATILRTGWSPSYPYIVRAQPENEPTLRFVQVPCTEAELEEV